MKDFIPKSVLIIGIQGALSKITAELLIKKYPQIKMLSPFSYELTVPFFTLNKLKKITQSLHAYTNK